MAKKRTNRPVTAPKDASAFIQGAQAQTATENPHDPNEPRAPKVDGKVKPYKTIGLQFNAYEWWELEQGAKKTKRSINSIIREGIIKELNSINKS